MEKVIIHRLSVSGLQTQLFEIFLPENLCAITGISISTDLKTIGDADIDKQRRGIGRVSLFVADLGDELFSELVAMDGKIPDWEKYGNGFAPEELFVRAQEYKPFETFQPTNATLINGCYEALVDPKTNYSVSIYVHYKTTEA